MCGWQERGAQLLDVASGAGDTGPGANVGALDPAGERSLRVREESQLTQKGLLCIGRATACEASGLCRVSVLTSIMRAVSTET